MSCSMAQASTASSLPRPHTSGPSRTPVNVPSTDSHSVATTASNPSSSANGVTSGAGLVVAITRTRPASRCSSMTPGAYGWICSASSSAAAVAAAVTASTGQPAAARAARRAVGAVMAVSPRTRKAAAMVLVPGTDRRCTPAAARWCEKAGPDAPLMSVRSRSKMAADWPIPSHHRQRDLDVAPSGVGVRADLVGLLDERHGRIVIEGGDAHVELDLEAEAAAGDRADADRRRHLGPAHVGFLPPGDDLEGGVEARRVAGGEELLGVRRPT